MFCNIVQHRRRSLLLLIFGIALIQVSAPTWGQDPEVLVVLNEAESRFVPPSESWFYETQEALRAEMQVVGAALDAQGSAYADPWKEHLRWALLEKNLVPLDAIILAEIELARRWMYSNRKGMELPFYAKVREKTDAYLDAAYTLSLPNLENKFVEHVQLARQQIAELIDNPTDAEAAALGRTLGWLERTRQIPTETAALRALLSHPNAQILVGKNLITNFMSTQSPEVEQTLPVSDSGAAPTTRRFQIPSTVHVSGTARTVGRISLELVPNEQQAELSIIYNGQVDSHCHADAGPVSFNLRTVGPMSASKPVTFDPTGIELGSTTVKPAVRTRVTNIQADNNFVRRLGERRINDPANKSHMSRRARAKAVNLLETEMDEKVEIAIDEIRAEIARMQSNASEFGEVFAPVVREGAAPFFHSTASSTDFVAANMMSQRREQFGAATPCPLDFASGDVRFRMHVSFLNNMMETIMAGKMFTDEYFMRYAKVLQPTLPLDLMVHSRTPRWAVIAAKPRPLELRIPAPNQFEFALHIASLEVDGESFNLPTTATVRYELVKNEFEEYYLERTAELEIESSLPTEHRDFLHKKLSAFFAPVLDAGGVSIPEGGSIGSLNSLQFLGVQADQDWLVVGVNVPKEFVDRTMKSREAAATAPAPPTEEKLTLPPPFATDSALSSYPTPN
ncbi:MAG: hypothetical protein SH868_04615 [Bythopirellula sp.]|nr:hypothetical protein [Bythopirellula sp.]